MKLFINTFMNCLRLRSFSYFTLLYNEFPFKIKRRKDSGSYFCYPDHGEPWILIGKLSNKTEQTTSLLHEIGHYIDYKKIKNGKAIEVFNNRKNSKRLEKSAWKYCLRLSETYNLTIDCVTAVIWLGTYGASYSVLNNKIRNMK